MNQKTVNISRLLFAGMLCIVLAACSKDVPKIPRLASHDRVLAFGDSLTSGVGTSQDKSYPAVLEELIGRSVYNAGVPGEVSGAALKRLPDELQHFNPQLVILCTGGNDFLRRMSSQNVEANIRKMIKLIRDHGASVILIGVPKPGVFLKPAPFYEKIADDLKVPLLEDKLPKLLSQPANKSDTIHLNAAGYRLLAEAIRELMRESGAV